MPKLSRHFRDRLKRPKRPKPKHRPPAPPGCRPTVIATTIILAPIHCADSYLDLHPVVPKNLPQPNQLNVRCPFTSATVPSSTQGGAVYHDDELPLRAEYLRAICIALNRNAVGNLKFATVKMEPDQLTPPTKPPQSDVQKSSFSVEKEVERARA